jgi:hypothetical protein
MTANAAVRFPSSPPHAAATEVARAKVTGRTPLEQLLHALNQPLTGLQCSMEVALAAPRTLEQYVRGLQDGLELTDRMRALVGAIREVTDMEDKKNAVRNHEEWSIADVNTVLRTALDDLAPVAEVKGVRVEFERNGVGTCEGTSAMVAQRRVLETAAFRLFESALASAVTDSTLCIALGGDGGNPKMADWLRTSWHAGSPPSVVWRAEIGLLVSQASFEQLGAAWERKCSGAIETVTIRLSGSTAKQP